MAVPLGIGVAAVSIAVALFIGFHRPPVERPAAPPALEAMPAVPTPEVAAGDRAPAPAPEAAQPASPPPGAHPPATSARRAQPPDAKTARPASGPPAEDLLRRAQEVFDRGETTAALSLASQAAAAGAQGPAHVLMGKVMMSERRFAEAEQHFAEAVRLDPGDAKAAQLLAFVRETQRGGP